MERSRGRDNPPILTLLDLAERHRGAIEYDWRTRFHIGWSTLPVAMNWAEAWHLVQQLASDPSSSLAAALAGWEHPMSREAIVLADLYDLTHKVAAGKKKIKPYPRPWDKRRHRFGRATRPQADIRAALRARGHHI